MKPAWAIGLAMLSGAVIIPAAADPLPRAASVSVCTDQYLLALADPAQVAAVSWQAASLRSPVRDFAAGYPIVRGMAEELLAVEADIVLFDPYGHPETASRLDDLGTDVLRLSDPVSMDDVEREVLRIAQALGREVQGRDLVSDLVAREQVLSHQLPDEAPRALYISPGGGGAGSGTYVDEVLRLAGFRNLQAELGFSGWQRVPLERLVADPPDVLVMSFFETSDPSLLDGFARHPLFRRMVRDTPTITVPTAPWVCAGPYLMDAAEHLAGARQRLFPGKPQEHLEVAGQ